MGSTTSSETAHRESAVIHIKSDKEFSDYIKAGGVVVVDFTASWCGPCKVIAPHFDELSQKYPGAKFLKVDVDECEQTAANNGVSAMPTFMVFVNGSKVDTMTGANVDGLKSMVAKHASGVSS